MAKTKIKVMVSAFPSETSSRSFEFDLEDFSVETIEDFNELTNKEREERAQAVLDALPEQPYWALDYVEIK